jgi:hypothetical protein
MEFLKVQYLVIFFSSYIPQIMNSQSKPILFADDTSIIIYHPDSDSFQNSSDSFQNSINDVFADLNSWFKTSKLTLNLDKINFMKFTTNNKTSINFNIAYDNKKAQFK